jgi:chromosome segregation ATPase
LFIGSRRSSNSSELEQARAQVDQAQQAHQQASEAGVLRVALDDAAARAERLAEQLRKAELDGLEIQRQLADALNRCTVAEEKAAEQGEQGRRQRERAEAAEKDVLVLRGELERALRYAASAHITPPPPVICVRTLVLVTQRALDHP